MATLNKVYPLINLGPSYVFGHIFDATLIHVVYTTTYKNRIIYAEYTHKAITCPGVDNRVIKGVSNKCVC